MSKSQDKNIKSKRGNILIVALWVFTILGILTYTVTARAHQKILTTKFLERRDHLHMIAESGVYFEIAKILDKKEIFTNRPLKIMSKSSEDDWRKKLTIYPVGDGYYSIGYGFRGSDGGEMVYKGRSDEESRININTIDRKSFEKLITDTTGVKKEEAAIIAGSIKDWRDEDNESFDAEATAMNEDTSYTFNGFPYTPKNAPFESLEEVKFVKNIDPLLITALEPYITVYGKGQININTCSGEVLSAMGCDEKLIEKIQYFRSGRSPSGNTSSKVFMDAKKIADDLHKFMKLTDRQHKHISDMVTRNLLAVSSEHFRIVSTGRLKDARVYAKITCVTDLKGNISYWREEFLNDA